MRAGYDIVTMGEEHLDLVVEAGVAFFRESNNDGRLTVSVENYRRLIEAYIGHPQAKSIVAISCGQVVGYTHIYYQQDFTVERVGELFQFFVRPEWRGTGVARGLVEAANTQYEAWGCSRAYAEAAPGLKDRRALGLFGNLFGKFGYTPVGTTFMKEFH